MHRPQPRALRTTIALLAVSMLFALPLTAAEEVGQTEVLIHDGDHGGPGTVLGWRRVAVAGSGPPERVAASLSARLGRPVVPDRRLRLLDGTTEPLFGEQWYLRNVGQTGGKPGADIGAPAAWGYSEGSGAVVAVVDTGVARDHPDLESQIWWNDGEVAANGIDDDGNGFVDDVTGWDFVDNGPDPIEGSHGTWVSGVVGAAVNGTGIAGTAPAAEIMTVRACGIDCSLIDTAAAIVYAIENGADVINLSLGGYGERGEQTPLTDAIDLAEAAGIPVVAASGNDGWNNDDLDPGAIAARYGGELLTDPVAIPSGLPNSNIVAVAATTDTDDLASFSNYGPASVDLGAPGDAILTTRAPDDHATVFGTSFSAPIVSGVVAIARSLAPSTPTESLIEFVVGSSTAVPSLQDSILTGGRVDAEEAARLASKAPVFLDVLDTPFRSDIEWIAARNITRGCNPPDNTLYCPTEPVTRGQMAAFLVRALGLPASDTDAFIDDDGSIFENDIQALAAAGITNGCDAGVRLYCPTDPVTRGQMAAFLARAYALGGSDLDRFIDDDGSIFENDIQALAAAGITNGCNPPDNDRFCPTESVSRAQMAAFLRRADP